MYRIPVFEQNTAYSYTIQLEGRSYRFTFTWNERTRFWYLDIDDDQDAPVLSGIRVVIEWPLTSRYRSAALPEGLLIAFELDASLDDPAFEDLGTRVSLAYLDSSELEESPDAESDIFTIVATP